MQKKCKKTHQQLSNLETYSDQHYTNSLQQQSIVISHYADNYRWMYYDWLLLFFILSFIQCSCEMNNMSVISEVTLLLYPVYCVQHIELDHLSKRMLNKKIKKCQNTQLLSFYLVWSSSVVLHMICYQMLHYYGAEEQLRGWVGTKQQARHGKQPKPINPQFHK